MSGALRELPTSIGPPLVFDGEVWWMDVGNVPTLHGLSVLSRALSEMVVSQARSDRLDVAEAHPHTVAQAEVTHSAAGLHPQLLSVRRPQLEQDLRAREASSDDLPAASGPPVRRLHDGEVLWPQEHEAMAGKLAAAGADERDRPEARVGRTMADLLPRLTGRT